MKKVFVFLMFILIMGCSSCFADSSYSLTFSEFQEIVENNGFTLDSSVNASVLSNALTYSPLIIKDGKYTGSSSYNYENYLLIYYSSRIPSYHYSANVTSSRVNIRVVNSSFNDYTATDCYLLGYNSDKVLYKVNYTGYHNTSYANYSDYSSEYTTTEFQSASIQKKILNDKLLYYENGIYLNYSTTNLLYKFDGVYTGDDGFETGSTFYSYDDVGFTYYSNESLNLATFYLQDIPLSKITSFKPDDYETLDIPGNFTNYYTVYTDKYGNTSPSIENCVSKTITYSNLYKNIESGHIYRLYTSTGVYNESGERETIYHCTTPFFSLDDWTSSSIKVLNIFKYLGLDVNDDVTLVPGGSSSTGGDFSLEDGFNGINNSINDLNNNINNTILGTPNESGEREGGLVGNLLSGLWEGFVSLIIPTNEQFGQWITETYESVNSRGGVLLYSKEFWISLLALINNEETGDLIFEFPEFKLPTSDVVIWEGMSFNVNEFIEKYEALNTFYITYIIIVSGIAIYYFCQYLWSLWQSLINGTGSVEISQNEEIDGWSVGQYGNVKMPHYKTKRNIKFK